MHGNTNPCFSYVGDTAIIAPERIDVPNTAKALTISLLCVLGSPFEGESVGLARAGGQVPNLHLLFGNGTRHAELQVRIK